MHLDPKAKHTISLKQALQQAYGVPKYGTSKPKAKPQRFMALTDSILHLIMLTSMSPKPRHLKKVYYVATIDKTNSYVDCY